MSDRWLVSSSATDHPRKQLGHWPGSPARRVRCMRPHGLWAGHTPCGHHLYVDSGYSDDASLAEISPINELLDRIAALGLSSPGDQIGPKSGQDEIDPIPVTHLVAAVEDCDAPRLMRQVSASYSSSLPCQFACVLHFAMSSCAFHQHVFKTCLRP